MPRRRPRDLVPRVHAWFVAPTYPLSRDWERRFIRAWGAPYQHNKADRILYLPNDTLLEFKSADDPDKLVSVGLDLLVLTECHLISDIAYRESLRPTLDSPGRYGLMMATGIPAPVEWMEDFKRQADQGNPNFFYINEPSWANPNITLDRLEEARAELPRSVFDHQYGAVWPESEGMVFRRINESCSIDVGGASAPIFTKTTGGPVYDGLDPAQIEDFMAYVALERRADGKLWQVGFDHYNKQDWDMQSGRAARAANQFKNRMGFCDITGANSSAVLPLIRKHGARFSGFNFGGTPGKKGIITELSAALDNDELRLYNLPLIKDELRRFTYTLSKAGNYSFQAPPGKHDDIVCALAMAVWAARRIQTPMSTDQRQRIAELTSW